MNAYVWDFDLAAALDRLLERGFTAEEIRQALPIGLPTIDGLFEEIHKTRLRNYADPDELAVSRALSHKDAPVETIFGIPLKFDPSVAPNTIEVRLNGTTEAVFEFGNFSKSDRPA